MHQTQCAPRTPRSHVPLERHPRGSAARPLGDVQAPSLAPIPDGEPESSSGSDAVHGGLGDGTSMTDDGSTDKGGD